VKILLSNDDGIFAPGLEALVCALSKNHTLTVVAPDTEKSAVSHGLTIRTPLFVNEVTIQNHSGYAVKGTPADCVKLGIDQFIPDGSPDLVISGINRGANTGVNVFYSGTVAAALEATFAGIPAMAVSLDSFQAINYDSAAKITAEFVQRFQENPFPGNLMLNINIPDKKSCDIRGIRICKQSKIRFDDRYLRRESPDGQIYYWLNGELPEEIDDIDLDDCALKNDWISVTPLMADLNVKDDMMLRTAKWLETENLVQKHFFSR